MCRELKDYLASAMMWDPSQDDRQLIAQFLESYYGNAAPFVRLYVRRQAYRLGVSAVSLTTTHRGRWTLCT